jgi:hypothetical protein
LEQDEVHPSLIGNASTESLIKMMKFGLWTDFKIMENLSLNLEDVIEKELNFYKGYIELKKSVQVSIDLICGVFPFFLGYIVFFRHQHFLEQFYRAQI